MGAEPVSLRTRTLGQGLEVTELGLGCMGMSMAYGPADDAESLATIRQALEAGVTLLDTADVYGPGTNERLVGEAIRGRREGVVVATKFGGVHEGEGKISWRADPEYVKRACDASLERLGVDHIDLYYQHRVDPRVPIEESVGAMAELVAAGKVRHLGISEASASTLRRAHAVHPISALQSEYSLWTRDVEDGSLPACRELGIGFVAYSPLGRGFLTGAIQTPDFEPDDFRAHNPRFQGENFRKNLALADRLRQIAARKGCSPGQLAIAWVLSRGKDVVAIPGTRRRTHLEENLAVAAIGGLSEEDLEQISEALPKGATAGDRYPNMEVIDS